MVGLLATSLLIAIIVIAVETVAFVRLERRHCACRHALAELRRKKEGLEIQLLRAKAGRGMRVAPFTAEDARG